MAEAKLEGKKEFERKLLEGVQALKDAAGVGLYLEGNNIITDAMRNCPVKSGVMKDTHYCTLPVEQAGSQVVEIGLGGPSENYCVKQHEDTSLQHKHGEAKWFQNAFNRGMAGFRQNVGALARAAFKSKKKATRGELPITPWEKEQGTTRK